MAGGPFEGMLMKIQFDDPLFEAWTQRPILTIAEGGAEIGEIKATAARIPEGDRDAWYREWTVTADRLYAQAEECAARGARISARYLYQRASAYYRNSYPLLFGRPIDPPRQIRLCTRGGGFCPRRGAVRSANHAGGHSIREHRPARLVLFRRRGPAPTTDLHQWI